MEDAAEKGLQVSVSAKAVSTAFSCAESNVLCYLGLDLKLDLITLIKFVTEKKASTI